VAHEDDAIRAVKAAREIHASVKDLKPATFDIAENITMHTGINTGLVVTAHPYRFMAVSTSMVMHSTSHPALPTWPTPMRYWLDRKHTGRLWFLRVRSQTVHANTG
jgi:hypothetical protein